MTSDAGPLRWYGQTFEGVAIPDSGDGVSEEARLRLAPTGVYEIILRQQPLYEFSGTLLFNGASPQLTGYEGQWQFKLVEEIAESEPTLIIQCAEGTLPFESLEIIPLGWEERPLDVTRLEVDDRRSTIRYRKDAPPESLKIRFIGINVFDVESVAARLWAHKQQFTSDPLAAFIRRTDEIRVDRLGNPTGKARKIDEHLLALFDVVLDLRASGRVCGLECRYQYRVAPDGPTASVPVLPVSPKDFRNNVAFFSSLEVQLRSWYRTTEAAKGAFVFDVTLYDTRARETSPALRLTQLLLPTESIADWA